MNDILTPCILQTIVICSTIVILGVLGVTAYRIGKGQQRSWGSYIFSASIILTLAVATFSLCFCSDRNVLDFISLASAIISIILAVVTIVYSYFINSRSAGQIDQLNKAAEDVSKATLSYEKSAESLQENIHKIIQVVNNVDKKTDKIITNLANHQNISPSNNSFSEVESSSATDGNAGEPFDVNTYVDNYIKISSPLGIMAIYACIKAYDSDRKNFNLKDLFDDKVISYCGGFLIATTSAGFVQININFDIASVSVMGYANIVKLYITKWLDEFKIDSIQGLPELKNKIDTFFEKKDDIEETK